MSGGYVMNEDGTLQQPETNASVPKLNAAALQFTPEAAELAARHFLALTEYAWATGDTHPMKDFSSEECEACLSMVEAIDSLYSSGGWSNGLHYELRKMIRSEEAPDLESTMVVEMLIENSTRDVFEHHTLEKRASSLSKMTLLLGWDGSTWKATGVGATAA